MFSEILNYKILTKNVNLSNKSIIFILHRYQKTRTIFRRKISQFSYTVITLSWIFFLHGNESRLPKLRCICIRDQLFKVYNVHKHRLILGNDEHNFMITYQEILPDKKKRRDRQNCGSKISRIVKYIYRKVSKGFISCTNVRAGKLLFSLDYLYPSRHNAHIISAFFSQISTYSY